MAEFKLGRIKFVWQGDWTDTATYYKDDVVRYGGKTYICVVGHEADTDFYVDLSHIPTRWNQMADGTAWEDEWTTNKYYKVNDLVKYGGNLYVANTGHTSAATAALGLEDNLGSWDLFAEGIDYKASWVVGTRYKLNDVVRYGAISYICNTKHTSQAYLEDDFSKWTVYAEGLEWKTNWTTGQWYKVGDVVKYGGISYVCNLGHESAATATLGLEADLGSWDILHKGIDYVGQWSNSTVRYKLNDVVKNGAGTWICTAYHTSAVATTFEAEVASNRWEQFVEGLEFESSWSSATIYQPGDLITYGGYAYVAKVDHSNQTPSTATAYWELLTSGFKSQGDWAIGTSYKVGDVVRLNGYTYVAVLDGVGHEPPNLTYWNRLNSGVEWTGAWTNGTEYKAGDAARYLTSTYICILAHTGASGTNRPDVDVLGTYWNLLAAGNENDVLTTEGDLVYYSGAGPTRLPIGTNGYVMMSDGIVPAWANYGVVPEVYYVAPHGVNSPAPEYGLTIDQPWASIRYACDQIANGIVNPNAAYLLKMNRTFIQAEIVEWVNYQIAHPTGIWVGFINSSETLCRRDMGLIVDALVYDMSHGSNFKTREALLSYFSGGSLITAIADEEEQLAAAIGYGLTVIDAVISNVAPAANYQTLNSIANPVLRFTDAAYVEEPTAQATITELGSILTTHILAGNLTNLVAEDRPFYTINVKTGQYYETLPIILPANTAIVGDELRSARVSPASSLIEAGDKAKTVEALTRLQAITSDIITNVTVTATTGNTETQVTTLKAGSVGSASAVSSIDSNSAEMIDIVTNGLGAVSAFVYPTPTGGSTNAFTAGYFNAARLILANKAFLQAEVSAWIDAQVLAGTSPFNGFVYAGDGRTKCERDVGYIVDALVYDITYGGNLETSVAARSYYSLGTFVETGEKDQALAVQLRIKDIIDNIATGNTAGWTETPANALTQDISGTPGSAPAAAFAQARIQEIYDTINTGTEPTLIAPDTSWVSAALVTAYTELIALKTNVQSDAVAYIKTQFPTLVFNEDLCSRDVGYIVDALGYDLMFGSNYRSIKAAMSYYRALTSTELVITEQKAAQLAILAFIQQRTRIIAASGSTVTSDLLWDYVIEYINTGTKPIVTGTNSPTLNNELINGAIVLNANKEFLAQEAVAYIEDAYPSYTFDGVACARDVRAIIDAMFHDMIYTGNSKTVLAGRYYRNALTGSKIEDAFYVKNACGLRNMTFTGLDGTSDGTTTGLYDALLTANDYGTQRPRAGAWVSLDPGWGPNDSTAWTTNKSTYVQNVTTFGTGCTGQKIDGILHSGGNKSIVSNDFTQVLDDGIGAWVTNLGLAELVSVFTYYNYAGYLAENGGKIRATNGNNSYGTFGSIAEGFDVTETAIAGTVNNRNTEADIRNILTSSNQVLLLEYGNAGNAYSTASYEINGTGSGAIAVSDEIRSKGVFEVRMTDPGDSSGAGGAGYITAANLAQTGNTTQITLAATDTNSSLAYVGMRIDIIAGTGVGQYGYIDTYNAGSKIATIKKMSDGTSGWEHYTGTAIVSTLDVTTSYTITPRIVFTAPPFTKSTFDMGSAAWTSIAYGAADGTYAEVASTSSSGGSLATFNVTRREGVYVVTLAAGGILYEIDDVVTIAGTSLGGTSPTNDLTLTVTKVAAGGGGAIVDFSQSGTAISGKFVAVSTGSSTTAGYSADGTTWSDTTLPGAATSWVSVAYGLISGIGYWVAIAAGGTRAAYSTNGTTWTTATLPSTSAWTSVTYGNGRFVAVASSSTDAAYSTNGTSWTAMGVLPASATWTAVTYGAGKFVAVASGGTNAAYSSNGTTWTATGVLPASTTWTGVAFGNNRFVAVASGGTQGAYSLNGTTWTTATLSASADWATVKYGNGLFYAVAPGQVSTSSPDGIVWTTRSLTHATPTVTATSKDIIGTFADNVLPQTGYWTNIVHTGSKFVAVGHNNVDTGYAASSLDGETWSNVTITSAGGFEFTAIAYNGSNKYVAFINNSRNIVTSTDGVTWVSQATNGTNNLPAGRAWSDAIYAGGKFVVVAQGGGTNPTAYSADGTTWSTGTIANTTWTGVTYGQPSATAYFVAVSASQAAAYSTDGITWTSGNTLPSSDVWSSVAYGAGVFVTVAGDTATATTKAAYSSNGTSWTAATMPGASANWTSVSYGTNGGFMAFAYGSARTAVSADGITWSEGPAISSGNWNTSAYGNNKFVALRTGGSTVAADIDYILNTNYLTTSSTTGLAVNDAIVFDATAIGGISAGVTYYVRSIPSSTTFTISSTVSGGALILSTGSGSMPSTVGKLYTATTYGSPSGNGLWVNVAGGSAGVASSGSQVFQGTIAKGRAYVSDNKIAEIWIHEPGSNYTTPPTITITDPNNTGSDATYDARVGNGVLAQPTWNSRGTNYTAAGATITGDGYADRYQVGTYVYVEGLDGTPLPGSNFQIAGIDDVYYRVVTVTEFLGTEPGPYTARLQVSPALGTLEAPEHGSAVTLRIRYSQVRLTGHDFLDIGTGTRTTTNYPGLPLTGYDPIPANETVDNYGGRVFYTSTDQDGNFRVGGLFNVEQATGVATLNADAFNIAGLQELQLGSVALGGSGATITEFSTDPFFTADSDTVVPTQRAIKAYITSQIGGGESSLNVNTLTAGIIYIAGSTITTTTGAQININTKMNFTGSVTGAPLALNYFLLR